MCAEKVRIDAHACTCTHPTAWPLHTLHDLNCNKTAYTACCATSLPSTSWPSPALQSRAFACRKAKGHVCGNLLLCPPLGNVDQGEHTQTPSPPTRPTPNPPNPPRNKKTKKKKQNTHKNPPTCASCGLLSAKFSASTEPMDSATRSTGLVVFRGNGSGWVRASVSGFCRKGLRWEGEAGRNRNAKPRSAVLTFLVSWIGAFSNLSPREPLVWEAARKPTWGWDEQSQLENERMCLPIRRSSTKVSTFDSSSSKLPGLQGHMAR